MTFDLSAKISKNPIPDVIAKILVRIEDLTGEKMDQITANIYSVGDGIPPHVDNPYAFGSNIISLSLISDVLLEFKRGENLYPLDLARKSLLIMTGEARYSWLGLKIRI